MLGVKFFRIPFATMTAMCALAGAAAAQDMPSMFFPSEQPPHSAVPAANQQTAAATPAPAPDQATAAQPAAPPTPGPATPAVNPLNKGQLQQLVAPIALYPDPLLSQVLMASSYPLEIVEADRWVKEPGHQALKGDELTNALKSENWDPSVMALVPFPKLLALMAEKLQWTQQLGNAFLAQQSDVMAAVQALRHDAMQAGNLKATPQCHCVIQTSGNNIAILPSDSQAVCVPVYNPRVVYGAWPEPEYPPDYFPIPVGFNFEPGYSIGFWPYIELADYGPLWGWWSLDWGGGSIIIDRGRYAALDPHPAFSGNTWVHDPTHRGGVAYSDPAVTARFGAARTAAVTSASRAAVRGPAAGLSTRAGVAAAAGGFAAAHAFAGHGAAGHVGAAGHAGGASHFGAATAGHFSARAGGGAAHFAHAGFAGGRMGGAAHMGGGARFGGGGGHAMAHASFGAAHMGGGGGGAFHGGGGGAPHGGGGGGGHGGGGGGGHGGGGHH